MQINIILIENYKDKKGKVDFQQNHYSKKAKGIYKNGQDSIRIIKWLAYYERSYLEIINYYYLTASILSCLNEVFQW